MRAPWGPFIDPLGQDPGEALQTSLLGCAPDSQSSMGLLQKREIGMAPGYLWGSWRPYFQSVLILPSISHRHPHIRGSFETLGVFQGPM